MSALERVSDWGNDKLWQYEKCLSRTYLSLVNDLPESSASKQICIKTVIAIGKIIFSSHVDFHRKYDSSDAIMSKGTALSGIPLFNKSQDIFTVTVYPLPFVCKRVVKCGQNLRAYYPDDNGGLRETESNILSIDIFKDEINTLVEVVIKDQETGSEETIYYSEKTQGEIDADKSDKWIVNFSEFVLKCHNKILNQVRMIPIDEEEADELKASMQV